MLHKCRNAVFWLVVFTLLPMGVALAQSRTTGQITGTVVDPSGAAVPGAIVKVSDASIGFTQTVKASASGVYVFPALQPGTYELRATATGFSIAALSGVVVDAARTSNVNITMKIGAATQTVTVSARGDILQTSNATLATTISPSAVQNLPLSGLNALPLAQLVPGATTAEGNQRYTTFNGLPAASINISVNGVDDNFQRYRTSTTGFFTAAPLRLGAFDEFTVSTSDLASEAGAEGSTTLHFVTKRGTNQLHGTAFWQAENSFFNANDYRNNAKGLKKPSQHLNDFGGSIGGPVLKNKLFFFGYLEYQRNPTAYGDSTQVLTSNAANGNFTYMGTDSQLHTVNLLSMAAANSLPGTVNSVTGAMINKIDSYVGNGKLSAGDYSGGATATPVTQTLSWLQAATYKNWWPTVRLDYQINSKLAWHGTWDAQWYSITAAPSYPGATLAGGGWWSNYFTVGNSLDWTISPTLLNQFNFGILETREEFNPATSGDPFSGQADEVINPPLGVNPVIPGFILPIPRNNPVYHPVDNLTWTRGDHTFTFGGDLRIATMYETEINNPPTYATGIVAQDPAAAMFSPSNFPNVSTANGNAELNNAEALYSFLVGRISSISGFNYVSSKTNQFAPEGAAINHERQTVGGVYFQDAWRMTPHFALNYGFRWQFSGAVTNAGKFWTGPSYADLLGPSTGLFQPGVLNGNMNPQINLTPHPYSADLMGPSPNFGLAWNPNFTNGFLGRLMGGSNTVIRLGAAISHYDEGWTTIEQTNAFTNPGAGQSVWLYPSSDFTPGSLSLGGTIPQLNAFPQSFNFPIPESAYTFAYQPFAAVDPNIRSPYVETWNFGIQRKLPGNNMLEIDYVGNHVVHSWLSYDMNEVNIFGNGFLGEFNNAVKNL
ncbi:MAG: carboxypeptidase regulatory-like domain-containing protein, partial [Acidobacteriota bacterium]|nr:carboxypeptidase regulatory-like domain-containing protein [Acidobacteriota bacterium]